MSLDLDRLRRETPGVSDHVHLNNAGSALMPAPVVNAMISYLELEARLGGHGAAEREASRLDAVRSSVARLIGAEMDEVALTDSATRAWQAAFYAIAQRLRPGDRILTGQAEYGANAVAMIQVAARVGVSVEVVPDGPKGGLDLDALEGMLDDRVRLIAITWIPTNGGLVNPAAEVGRLARARGIPYLLDACQAVGQRPVGVAAIGCDMLSAAGRKFLRGPRGTGFLYVRRDLLETLEPAFLDHTGAAWVAPDRYELRPDARRFETYEHSHAARLGLGVAVDYGLALGLDRIEERCRMLSRQLRDSLAAMAGVQLFDRGPELASLVTFAVEGCGAPEVKARLGEKRIAVSVSAPASTLYDSRARQLPALVRASPHYYNSDEDIARLVEAVAGIVGPTTSRARSRMESVT